MHFVFPTTGVCSTEIKFDMDDNLTISNIAFTKGCPGNILGIASLAEGKTADEIINAFKGIACGSKSTSCPDQFAAALLQAKKAIEGVS